MKSTLHGTTYEKRHSKPCRFFQKGICPLSADRCDFAHVKIHILPVGYSPGHLKPSQAGQCDHNESLQPVVPMIPSENGMPNATNPHAAPEAKSPSSKDVVTVAQSAVTQVPCSPKLYTHKPVLLPPVLGREPNVNVAGAASVSSGNLAQLIFRDGDSSPTSDVPSLSDGDSEPPSAACEAPELTERWPGSPSVPSPMVYYHPSPGLFYPGSSFMNPAYGPWIPSKQATRSESRRQGMSTRKLKAMKSKTTLLPFAVIPGSHLAYLLAKQCKFFKKDGRCPQGSLCTFIHDSSSIRAPQSEQESPSDSSSQSASEPHSKAHEDHEQNIFPITWRVIGGGVMMGGQNQSQEKSALTTRMEFVHTATIVLMFIHGKMTHKPQLLLRRRHVPHTFQMRKCMPWRTRAQNNSTPPFWDLNPTYPQWSCVAVGRHPPWVLEKNCHHALFLRHQG
ncbi:hypothetical protein BJV74DRAFT_796144 [Russula compacta]|nr:hypothetical protein BJV74DRAFT_796144 [Russula compacta]